jgi:hypothetical protein
MNLFSRRITIRRFVAKPRAFSSSTPATLRSDFHAPVNLTFAAREIQARLSEAKVEFWSLVAGSFSARWVVAANQRR